jgi:hypothetical protein
MDLSLTIGMVIVSLSIFILFAFGAARNEKVVIQAQTIHETPQAGTALTPAQKK